jgi:hypothetical protein
LTKQLTPPIKRGCALINLEKGLEVVVDSSYLLVNGSFGEVVYFYLGYYALYFGINYRAVDDIGRTKV